VESVGCNVDVLVNAAASFSATIQQQPRERNTGKPADRSGPGGPPDELSPETLSKIHQQFDPYELAEERCADRYALQRLRAWRIRGST
jgi:hypothetical protein